MYENQHKLVIHTHSGSKIEVEIDLVPTYLPFDLTFSDFQCIISSLPHVLMN